MVVSASDTRNRPWVVGVEDMVTIAAPVGAWLASNVTQLLPPSTDNAMSTSCPSRELGVLNALREMLPDLAEDLGAIMKNVVDLLPLVRDNVCHPDFITKRSLTAGTYSIKNVLPALVPSMSYANLEGLAEGGEASRVLAALAHGVYKGREADDYRQQLLDYCEQDTLAMVEIQRALESLCS